MSEHFDKGDKDFREQSSKASFIMARPERLELPTLWFEARYSIQLSYGRKEG